MLGIISFDELSGIFGKRGKELLETNRIR